MANLSPVGLPTPLPTAPYKSEGNKPVKLFYKSFQGPQQQAQVNRTYPTRTHREDPYNIDDRTHKKLYEDVILIEIF
jgi:hypothetical protein